MSSKILLEIFVAVLRFTAKSNNQGKGRVRILKLTRSRRNLASQRLLISYRRQSRRDFAVMLQMANALSRGSQLGCPWFFRRLLFEINKRAFISSLLAMTKIYVIWKQSNQVFKPLQFSF